MIKIKSVKKMVESVSETEWDRAQDFAKSIGGDLSNKSPREMVAYLDRNGYELKNSEFISDTLLDLYGSGSDNLSWRIQRIVKKAGFSFRPDGDMDYSSRGLFSGICYGPKGEKRSIASLLSGKDLNDYMEWRDIVKKYSSWIKESNNAAKGKKRRIVEEEEDEMPIKTNRFMIRSKRGIISPNAIDFDIKNFEAYASSGQEADSISIGFTKNDVLITLDMKADDILAAIREYVR